MKTLKKITLLFLVFIALACETSEDNPNQTTTVAEDQANIELSMNQILNCLDTFEAGDFSTELKDFFNITNGEIYSDYAENLLDQLDVFNFDLENFMFNSNTGTYQWNTNTQSWNYTNNLNDKMVFYFPKDENSSSNNIELALTSYNSTQVMFDSEAFQYPTSLTGYVKVDNNEVFSINLSNVTYEVNNTFSFPSNLNLVVHTSPFTHTISIDQNSSTDFHVSYDFQNNGDCVTSINTNFSLNTSNYENIVGLEDFNQANGVVLHQDFELRYTAELDNLATAYDNDNLTVDLINQYINIEAYYNNSKVGDLMYNEDSNEDFYITIIYQDGTSDDVTEYVGDDFVNQLETIFTAFID